MYEKLSNEISERIVADRKSGVSGRFAADGANAVRRTDNPHDRETVWRTAFIRDIDKIMHCPLYNRYADKTQALSFYKNDDITRRGLHVQLVSRIARTIGGALGLNLDLIEAIALGHDIGHTPFGHTGERILDGLLEEYAGKRFSHNIQSVRVLDRIFPYNITLQTLMGIAAHDGELELSEYRPAPLDGFKEFDGLIDGCFSDKANVKRLVPSTLEGCVVRISDIIAYLGKDRQDAERAHIIKESDFDSGAIGSFNAEIINNLIVNIIENSYGKDYIKLDAEHFSALQKAKAENYKLLYLSEAAQKDADTAIKPMAEQMFTKLYTDLADGRRSSPIFTHHIDAVNAAHCRRPSPYGADDPYLTVSDYIASMTDDYFIDLFEYLFPKSPYKIKYKGYFDDI